MKMAPFKGMQETICLFVTKERTHIQISWKTNFEIHPLCFMVSQRIAQYHELLDHK